MKKLLVKCLWNWLQDFRHKPEYSFTNERSDEDSGFQVSISPTFYEQHIRSHSNFSWHSWLWMYRTLSSNVTWGMEIVSESVTLHFFDRKFYNSVCGFITQNIQFLGNFNQCHVAPERGGLWHSVTNCTWGGCRRSLISQKSVTYYLTGPLSDFLLPNITNSNRKNI